MFSFPSITSTEKQRLHGSNANDRYTHTHTHTNTHTHTPHTHTQTQSILCGRSFPSVEISTGFGTS